MFRNPFRAFDFSNPFGTAAMKRSRNLFGTHTTPREWKHAARDIPFGMGAMSLYVDGTNGSDSNDGESWKTAIATIQGAVDIADPWTQIFVKAGTYTENVSIANDSIQLIGQSRDSVIIQPVAGTTLSISGDFVVATRMSLLAPGGGYLGAITGKNILLDTIKLDAPAASFGLTASSPDNSTFNNIYVSNPTMVYAFDIAGTTENLTISNSKFNLSYATSAYVLILDTLHKSKIFNNDFGALPAGCGLQLASTCSDLSIFHNNLLSNNTQINDLGGTRISIFENFYDDHTNIDNGHGIATEPYAFTGGIDLHPLAFRNGWNAVSLRRSLLRKKTAAQTTQAATAANGTAWVDLKTITPTTSDIELYQLKMTVAGSWAGNAKYRIIVGSTKVYPFPADKNITSGTLESLIFPINIQINETAKIQFRSDNAGDGAGDTVTLDQLDYATVL